MGDDFMFYFLNKIDDYIRTNGIPFRNIEIDSSYLPAYFNYAILSKIRNSGTLTFDMFAPSKYTLAYDDNNCLYLEAIGFDGRTRILVYSSNDCRRMVNSSIKGYKVTDGAIYKMTCLVKYTNAIRDIIMNNVKSNYPNETVEYKTKIFYGLMQDIFEKVYKEVGNDIYSLANYSKEINEATDNIIEYINYLNMAYKNDLLEYDKEKLVTVNFVTPDCDTVIRKSSDGNGNNNRERINKIIPANDRVYLILLIMIIIVWLLVVVIVGSIIIVTYIKIMMIFLYLLLSLIVVLIILKSFIWKGDIIILRKSFLICVKSIWNYLILILFKLVGLLGLIILI